MKNLYFLVIIVITLVISCAAGKPKLQIGKYASTCIVYSEYELIMDSTFRYKLAYLDEDIVGHWKVSGNKLILESDFFLDSYITKKYPNTPKDIIPGYKYTNNEELDIYIIKKDKLIPTEKNGKKITCTLLPLQQ